jgi:flagellar motor switch/type III secretory pathway protein FliN
MHLVEIGSGGMQIGGLYSLDGGDVIPRARPMNA